jgi:predicted ArsR family transcriptional regulator
MSAQTSALQNRLRREILQALQRRGAALPIELAALTLSFVDEIRPVLEELEAEGLIELRNVRGGPLVALTARGREQLRRLS